MAPVFPIGELAIAPLSGRDEASTGSGYRPQADEDPARGVAHGLPAAAEDAPDRPAREGVCAVAEETERDPAEPERDRLRPDRAVRVDELRHEREKEERGLRIEHVYDDALAEDAPRAARRSLDAPDRLVLAEQLPDPDVHEVGRADVLH